jgi:hypothetical protein
VFEIINKLINANQTEYIAYKSIDDENNKQLNYIYLNDDERVDNHLLKIIAKLMNGYKY